MHTSQSPLGSPVETVSPAESLGKHMRWLVLIALTGIGILVVILGSTSSTAPAGFAPLTIGLTLAVMHFVAIPVTNASFNPARSLGAAIFGGPEALGQLWLFVVAPLAGGALGAIVWRTLLSPGESPAGVGQK